MCSWYWYHGYMLMVSTCTMSMCGKNSIPGNSTKSLAKSVHFLTRLNPWPVIPCIYEGRRVQHPSRTHRQYTQLRTSKYMQKQSKIIAQIIKSHAEAHQNQSSDHQITCRTHNKVTSRILKSNAETRKSHSSA